MNILIRDVPAAIAAAIEADAAAKRISRQDLLIDILHRLYGEPPAVAGWFRADRNGELTLNDADDGATCHECGQPLDWPWFGILTNGQLHGPVCTGCATSQ